MKPHYILLLCFLHFQFFNKTSSDKQTSPFNQFDALISMMVLHYFVKHNLSKKNYIAGVFYSAVFKNEQEAQDIIGGRGFVTEKWG